MKTRRSIRLKGYDYAQEGVYFITICTFDKQWLFGNVVDGVMKLNKLGQVAYDEWQNTTTVRSNVILHDFVVMPNHIHGIIEITGRGELHSPTNEWEQNKNECIKGECNSPLQSPSQTIGAIV
ncbi:MAG: transposase, partial [Paludibacteraceae bacterium]|nr:transposase [Paludibacteraceae bacterium]